MSTNIQEGSDPRTDGALRGIRVTGLPEPISHYTDAVIADNTLYMSGITAVDSAGAIVGKGDPVEQARQIFRNMQLVLEAVGGRSRDIVKVTVFVRDMSHRVLINPVRQEFFGDHRPASTLVEVSKLALDDSLLEVEAIAVINNPTIREDLTVGGGGE